jgi:hypothetical protein
MVNVGFLAPELGRWDMLEGASAPDALILTFFTDERPLRGAAGLCDWRLCGRLSRLLIAGRLSGTFGETTLYPAGRRLPFQRLVLFGLGAADRFDENVARDAARRLTTVMAGLGLERPALVPPGRSTGRLSARRALEIYLEEVAAAPAASEASGSGDVRPIDLAVVESPAGQKEAADLARRGP